MALSQDPWDAKLSLVDAVGNQAKLGNAARHCMDRVAGSEHLSALQA
jgi:hypothetical protein